MSLLLCVDYDGTLTPIVAHPSRARLSARTKQLLKRLASLPGVRVALVSGRALRDVRRLVGLRGLCYVGNHGLELQGAGLRYVHPIAQTSRSFMKRLAAQLRTALQLIRGAEVEDKGLTVSLHWRRVPRSASRAFHRLVGQYLAPHRRKGVIRITQGKRVIEVRPPVAWDKGRIIAWILGQMAGQARWTSPFVIYLGDDRTDEDAFRLVNRRRGLSVFVGRSNHRTAARHRLQTPLEAAHWLSRVVAWRTHTPIR
ncbi:MAG: trehalose-phosphatase [Candidatus Omnitrophica bacterium]|nr:trehalose-phosphatase [Candidatus Omnitrophota bacterium]